MKMKTGSSPKMMGMLSRMPSMRWERYAGSDVPMKTMDQEARGDQKPGMTGKSFGNPLSSDTTTGARAPSRQYLKSGKYVGTDLARKLKGGRSL